jgi:hypothetical protein
MPQIYIGVSRILGHHTEVTQLAVRSSVRSPGDWRNICSKESRTRVDKDKELGEIVHIV